jgi:hypothetical protein
MKTVGEAELGLQVEQQVEHLRLHRLVQRRDRLVQDHHARLQGQRPRDVDALPLPARELVRIALGEAPRLQAHARQQVARARQRFAPARRAPAARRRPSPRW